MTNPVFSPVHPTLEAGLTRRLLLPAAAFALIVALVAGGLGWVTVASLRVERAEREATARAARLNHERLALWRLDGHILPVLAVEGNRPFAHYAAPDADQPPSPLLSAELPDWMVLHFHLDPAAGWRSPQVVPADVAAQLRAASPGQTLVNVGTDRDRRLADLAAKFPPTAVVAMLANVEGLFFDPSPPPPAGQPGEDKDQPRVNTPAPPVPVSQPPASAGRFLGRAENENRGEQAYRAQLSQRVMNSKAEADQLAESQTDFKKQAGDAVADARKGAADENKAALMDGKPAGAGLSASAARESLARREPEAASKPADRNVRGKVFGGFAAAPAAAAPKPAEAERLAIAPARMGELAKAVEPPPVRVGPFVPRWLVAADGTEALVLVRAARPGEQTVYQGVVLDWPKLHQALAGQVADLFPDGRLVPVRTPDASPPEQTMTALPARLDPGAAVPLPPAGWTPLRVGLALAWAAALIALTAVGAGGAALVGLSERRIRFVSAVTHELRTPLTSLRLYLDLLASGMIADEAKQKEYIATLATESDRLHRLVENVLDFARLEKRAVQAHVKTVPVAELLDEVRATWADRLAADGKELVIVSTVPEGQSVTTDPRVAAQVVGNLVDNARKYSKDAADGRVWVWAKPGGRGRVAFEVEDRGPGVPARDRRGLFRPFCRGTAMDTPAGGAGLGLALAKQWAGVLGGKLTYRPADGGVGACFRLELPGA